MAFRRRYLIPAIVGLILIGNTSCQQKPATENHENAKPKLVIGLVIDQMRADYLERFRDDMSTKGFVRMTNEGWVCAQTFFRYVPTQTAPGHATIYTGVQPAVHGIVANSWYDRERKEAIYCVTDDDKVTIGVTGKAGQRSPHQLLVPTIGDFMKEHWGDESKVIALALKDRSSILPAGHKGDLALWYDDSSGHWISSSYYGSVLPKWVDELNARQLPDRYLSEKWDAFLPDSAYTESRIDSSDFERPFEEHGHVSLGYDLRNIGAHKGRKLIKSVPWGNTFTFDAARAAIEGETLGRDEVTDLLAISLSSTDYIGHQFGPYSKEVQDTYLRLDRDLAAFIQYLDDTVGRDNYLMFLTADHGVAPNSHYARELGHGSGFYNEKQLAEMLKAHMEKTHESGDMIEAVYNEQVVLDHEFLAQTTLDKETLFEEVSRVLLNSEGIKNVVFPEQGNVEPLQINGYMRRRSGDVFITFQPYWTPEYTSKGATHGSGYEYDTHVPLIWFGAGVPSGGDDQLHDVTEIASTIGNLLGLSHMEGLSNGKTHISFTDSLKANSL